MYVDIAKSCPAGEENSVLSENTNSSIDDISFVPYDRIKSKKGLAFTSPFFLWEDYKIDFFAFLGVVFVPLQKNLNFQGRGGSGEPLSFGQRLHRFETAFEYYGNLFF